MKIYGNLESNMKMSHPEDWSRGKEVIEREDSKLEVRVLQLDAIFGHIQLLLKEQIKNSVQTVEVDSNEVPYRLRGDPDRSRRALLNYTVNAAR